MSGALIITTVSGFLQKFEADNVKILQSLGFEVRYAANPHERIYEFPENSLSEMGVAFHPIRINKSPYRIVSNLRAISETARIIKEENIDLVHCHTPVGGLVGRVAAQYAGIRGKRDIHVIYTAHGFHFYKGASLKSHILYGTAEKLLARLTDDIILINKEDFEAALKFRLKKSGKAFLIPGVGLDRNEFKPYAEEDRKAAREKLRIKERDFLIVSVGELNENKNHAIVIEALRKLLASDADASHIKYLIAGEGPFRSGIEGKIKQYGMEKSVILCGYCPARADDPGRDVVLQDLLGAADVFCFPSIREGLGMAPLEALAMGVPVLAADNRGSREYMQAGYNGYVCAWNDADSWVRGIERIMSLSDPAKAKLSTDCRESTERFDRSNTLRKMQEIYERAVRRISKKQEYIQG